MPKMPSELINHQELTSARRDLIRLGGVTLLFSLALIWIGQHGWAWLSSLYWLIGINSISLVSIVVAWHAEQAPSNRQGHYQILLGFVLATQGMVWAVGGYLSQTNGPSVQVMTSLFALAASLALYARFPLYLSFTLWLWPIEIAAVISDNYSSVSLMSLIALMLIQLLTWRSNKLFKQLQQKHYLVKKSNEELEDKVSQRTAQLNRRQSQLNLALQASDMGIWDWNLETRTADVSTQEQGVRRVTESNQDRFMELVHSDDRKWVRQELVRHLKGKSEKYQVRYRLKNEADQGWLWIEDSGKAIEWDSKGRVLRMIGTRRDVTAEVTKEQELSLAASLFNHSENAVMVLNENFTLEAANPQFCKAMAANVTELIGKPLSQISASGQVEAIINSLVTDGRWEGQILEKRYNGESFPFQLGINAIYTNTGTLSHYIAIGNDRTETLKAKSELNFLSNYDKLTGLANRSHFHQHLEARTNNKKAHQEFFLVLINIDRFNSINDSLGHEIGDQLLQDIATRLSSLPPPASFVARLGGDEFVVVVDVQDECSDLHALLEKILLEVSRPCFVADHELIVTASIGVVPAGAGSALHLLNHASVALNQARFNGGNNYQFYDQAFRGSPFERLQIEKALRKATGSNELDIHYQPKLNLLSRKVDALEALVRWTHPALGPVAPSDFIPLAEETGLINELGQQVLIKACEEASTWRKRGFGDIRVSVNMSGHQLRRENIADQVAGVLAETGLPPGLLEIELTESVIMESIEHSLSTLNRIHAMGVRIALDDFGTGYSSLSYLQRLPIDVLKIDRSFVTDIHDSKDESAIINAIIAMAKSLNMEVVAEGVENHTQLKFLEQSNCDYIQGFIVSEALPPAEMLNLLRHYNYKKEEEPSKVH